MGVFVAVAKAGSLSGAARLLGQPLTNVSRLLAQIEAHLGVTLLERTTRRLIITREGRDYLEACRRVLDEIETAEAGLRGTSKALTGDIAVTAPVGLGRLHVVPIVSAFLAAHPRIDVRLLLADRIVDMMSEGVDVAVRVGKMKDSGLTASRVGSLKLVACAAPAYLEHRGTPASVAHLNQHDCITFAELPGGSRWTFNSRRHGRLVARVHSRLNVNTADAAVGAAIAGVGIARVLSYQAQDAIQRGLVVPVLQKFEDGSLPVVLVSRPARPVPTRVRAFLRFAAPRLKARLDGGDA